MAYLAADPILTRIREVLESGAGVLRTIASGTYYGDFHEGLSEQEQARRALTKPRYDVRAVSLTRNEASPPNMHSLGLKNIEIEVKVTRNLTFSEATADALRDDMLALAIQDGDVISQALGYTANLATTTSGTATGLVSGVLEYEGSDIGEVETPDGDRPGRAETLHRFTGRVAITQATS